MKKENSKNNMASKSSNKENNILVWLDFDAYSYVNFGIINALAKKGNFDFFGIVTTKQDLSFFENQKLIEFKKLMYFPDCYKNDLSFDLDRLKEFEKTYNLNLWLDIFSERSFYKYWTHFYKFSREEILSIVGKSLDFFIKILEDFKPKLILMQHPGENISNLLLYRIAKGLGIKVLFPNPIYIHNRIVISDNIENNEILDGYNQLIKDFKNEEKIFDEKYIKNENLSETVNVQSSYNYGTSNFSQKFNHYVKRISNDPEQIYKNFGKTKLNMLTYRFQNNFKVKKRKKFLDKNTIKIIEDEKFFYFPLQSEPESKILTTSPFYSNQIELIENIAKSIPINFVLYVKEHPIQKVKLWRDIDDYKKIISIPNVKLVNPYVNAQELISKSKGIISISGATGFEALFYKKPVIIFADEYYEGLSLVTKVKSFSELTNKIKNTLFKVNVSNKELNALMKSLEINSIPIPYFSMIKDGIVLSSIQRHENNPNLTIMNFEKFYESYIESFELMATIIHSKI